MQSTKKSLVWSKLLRRRQNCEKKTGQKGTFWKFFTKKIAFFRRALPLKISVDWRRKILGSISQNWISQNNSMGDPLGRQGVESLGGGGGGRTSPPLNPPLLLLVSGQNPEFFLDFFKRHSKHFYFFGKISHHT